MESLSHMGYNLCVTAAIIFGAILRLVSLGKQSFYGDEIFDISVASGSLGSVFNADLWHGPLNYYILFFWTRVFGTGEFISRVPSVTFSVLAGYLVYRIARELLDERTALLAGILALLSPFTILFSQTTRWYSLFYLLSALSTYLMLRYFKEGKKKYLAGYCSSAVLLLYCEVIGLLVLFIHFISAVFVFKKSGRAWISANVLAVILSLPWLVSFVYRYLGTLGEISKFPSQSVHGGLIARAAYVFLSFSFGQTVLPFNFAVSVPAALLFFLLLALGVINIFKRDARAGSFLMLYLALLLTPVFTILNAPHYMMSAFVPFCVLVAGGLSSIRKKTMFFAAAACISAVYFYSLCNLYSGRQFHRMEFLDDWRGLASRVRKDVSGRDVVYSSSPSFGYYYLRENGTGFEADRGELLKKAGRIESRGRVFYVFSPLSGVFQNKDSSDMAAIDGLKGAFHLEKQEKYSLDPDHKSKQKLTGRPFPRYRIELFIFQRP